MMKWGFHCNDLIWYHTWPPDVWEVHLTKCQHDQKPDQMSTWSKAWSLGGGVNVISIISIHIWNFGGWYLISYCFFLHIFLSGKAWHRLWMKWHGLADEPHPQGRYFIEMLQNIILKYISFSIPQNLFNIVNVSGIEIHLKFTYPYYFYLNVKLLDGYISLHIDIFVT